jgi:hypothetical protein
MPGQWVRNALWRSAKAVPSLDLRFADSKSLVDSRTGQSLITFTRASSATYIDSAGTLQTAAVDVPRFDHNPTTGESLGLLVEEQRTNLLVQSENFGTTWTANGLLAFGSGSTLNALTAPDGQTTADLITENTSNSQHNVNQTSTTTGAKRFSVFAKQGPGARLFRLIDFNATDGAQGETYFNLSTGAVVSGPGTIQALPNGWYRCSIQSTTTVTSTYFISIATSALAFAYTGDGASGIYLWGAQLEAGAFPTSYIPTTAAAATRSADVASITGANFSSWYRQDEGTVFADVVSAPNNTIAQLAADISDALGNERIFTRRTGAGSLAVAVIDGGVTQADVGAGPVISGGARYTTAASYRLNSINLATNGQIGTEDTTATIPTPDRMFIGQNFASTQQVGGTIRRLTFFPQRLPNSTLQAITQ